MKLTVYILLLGYFISFTFSSCNKEPGKEVAQQEKKDLIATKIDSIAQSYVSTQQVVGFSIAVLQRRDTLYAKGFGYSDLENKTPVTTETIFPMASISKLITSLATMKLVEEGKLSLESTLLEVLPDFPKPEQAKKIRMKHLLSHTSGLPDYAEYGDSLFVYGKIVPTQQHYYDFFEKNELLFEPGTRFSYSNSGFLLMGIVIEQLTEMLFEDFVEQNISEPLGLTSLKHRNRNKANGISRRYDLADSSFTVSMMDTVYYFKGDGGMSATALDLARLPFAMVDGDFLSQKSLTSMMQSRVFPDESLSDYGLGVRKGTFGSTPIWGHTGGHINYWSTLAFYPEQQISIVVFANTDRSPVDALLVEGAVAQAVLDIKQPHLLDLEKQTDLDLYIGEYSNLKEAYVGDDVVLFVEYQDEKGRLYRNGKNNPSRGQKLYYLGEHTFAPEKYPMDRVVFDMNSEGKVVGFRDYYNGLYMQMGKKMK